MGSIRPGAGLVLSALMLTALSSAAPDGTLPYRLAYVAPPACPTAADFDARIHTSTDRARIAKHDEAAVDLTFVVVEREDGFAGELTVRHPDGSTATRSIPAGTCDETVAAAAFIAAIVVDPDARPPTTSGPLPTPTATAAPELAPASVPTAATTGVAVPPDVPPPETAQSRSARKDRSVWFGASASAGGVGAVAPKISPDFGVGIDVGSVRDSPFAPQFGLSGHLATSAEVVTPRGSATFERWSARLSGCPLRTTGLGAVVLRPCVWFEAGSLRAKGLDTQDPQTVAIPWTALGATGRADVSLGGHLTLGLEAGAVFPLLRDQFFFTPDGTRAYQVVGVGFVGTLSLGLRIL